MFIQNHCVGKNIVKSNKASRYYAYIIFVFQTVCFYRKVEIHFCDQVPYYIYCKITISIQVQWNEIERTDCILLKKIWKQRIVVDENCSLRHWSEI